MRARLGRALVIALFLVVSLFYPLLAPRAHRIDSKHFDLIQPGMSKADVEAIFGVPAGKYDWAEEDGRLWSYIRLIRIARRQTALVKYSMDLVEIRDMVSAPTHSETWISRHGAYTVNFDDRDRVVSTHTGGGVRIVPPWKRWWEAIWER